MESNRLPYPHGRNEAQPWDRKVIIPFGFAVMVLAAIGVAAPPYSAAAVLAGVTGVFLLIARPDVAFAAYFAVQALVSEDILLVTEKLYPTIYRVNLPYIGLNVFEVGLLLLLAITLLQRGGRFYGTALDLSVWFFGLSCAMGYLTCVWMYGDPARLFEPRRILHFFIAYFLTVNLIRTKESLQLFLLIYFTAVILKSIQGIALFNAGEGLQIKWRIRAIFTGWGDSLNFVTYLLFLTTFILAGLRFPFKRLFLWSSPLVLYGFLFSYKRAYYVAILAGLGALFFMLGRRARIRFILLGLVGAVLLTGLITAAGQWEAIGMRVASIFEPAKESSANYRIIEYRNALISIRHNPVFGIGLGGVMPMVIYIPRTNLLGVHNTFLWVAVKMGAFGFFTYLLLNFVFVKHLLRQNRSLADPFLRNVSRAILCSYVAFLAAQMFAPMFSQIRTATWLGVFAGLGMMLRNMEQSPSTGRGADMESV